MRIDVSKIIDDSPINKLHITVVAVGAIVLVVDGYDLVSMGLVIPRLSEDWGIQPSEFAVALSVAMFGVMVGSGVAGTLGDYIGRRWTILGTVFIAGVFMLITPSAENMTELVVYRFFTGLGAGGCIPIAIAYASEYMPERLRNRLVVLMYTGAGLGSVVAGIAAPTVMLAFDWQGVFYLGGILSLLVCLIVYIFLPESLKFLISKDIAPAAAGRLIKRLDPTFTPSPDDEYFIAEHTQATSGSPVRELFGNKQTLITLLAWAVMLGNQFMIFLLALWLPTLLTESGITLQTSLYILAIYNVGGIAGGIIFAVFADKKGPGKVLMITYPVAGLSVAALGLSLGNMPLLIVVAVLAGAFLIGSSFCLGPFVAALYPTRARSTGIGWALSVGRIGSIVSPLVGGYALAQGIEIGTILLFAGIPPILCGLTVVWLNRVVLDSNVDQQPAIHH